MNKGSTKKHKRRVKTATYEHVPAPEIYNFDAKNYVPIDAVTHFKRLPSPADHHPCSEDSDDEEQSWIDLDTGPGTLVSTGGCDQMLYQLVGGLLEHCETEFSCRIADGVSLGEGRQLITIQCTYKGGVRAVQKLEHASPEWISVPMTLTPEELMQCYVYQTNAVGKPYKTRVISNLLLGKFACGCCARPTDTTEYFCSELVTASIVEFGYLRRSVKPWLTNPEMLFKYMRDDTDWYVDDHAHPTHGTRIFDDY